MEQRKQREVRSLENINRALEYIQKEKAINLGRLVHARGIYEGNVTMVLGLVWTLILRLQIGAGGEDGLLSWCQLVTEGYRNGGNTIENFSRSWRSGLPFVAIIHKFRPDLIEFDRDASNRDACEAAFSAAASVGITRILDVEDICDTIPNAHTVIAYVAQYFNKFVVEAASESEFQIGTTYTASLSRVIVVIVA